MPTLVVSTKAMATRLRAGHRFSREASIVEVTDEQAESIRVDSHLVVDEKASDPAPVGHDEPASEPKPIDEKPKKR